MAKATPEAAANERLFVYGSLQQAEVQRQLIGRELQGEADTLAGYRRFFPAGYGYPMILPEAGEVVAGMLLHISPAELARFDAYEGEAYRRVRVRLQSAREAWVYISSGLLQPPDEA